MRCFTGFLLMLILVAPAAAQFGYGQVVQPNIYNRQSQPLSPYLNLLGRGNPGVNYYYGVRPGLPSGPQLPYGQFYNPLVGPAYGGFLQQSSIPQSETSPSPRYDLGGQPIVLRSASHPVIFGNQYNGHGTFSSVYSQTINRGGSSAGQQRTSSVGGLGTANPQSGVTPPK